MWICYVPLFCIHPVQLLWCWKPAPCSLAVKRGVQSQHHKTALLDRAGIKGIVIILPLLARFLKKANSGHATPRLPPLPIPADAGSPGGIPHPKTCIPGRKSSRFSSILRCVGLLGCPVMDSAKKKNFQKISGFSPLFIFKAIY